MQSLPRSDCPAFYDSPFVKATGDNARWTVSNAEKIPLDMYLLKYRHVERYAQFHNELSLVTLPELHEIIPGPINCAYYLDALVDNYVVLDVEPKCPDDVKAELLSLPYIYGERSMSGKGYHLVFPLPSCIDEFPIAKTKSALKETHGWYEILLNHYVTFTLNPIDKASGSGDFEALFRDLCTEQKEVVRNDVDIDGTTPDEIPDQDKILSVLRSCRYRKTPGDFHDDISKYEYGHVGYLHYKLKCMLETAAIQRNGHEYTDNDKAWLLYTIAQEKIPYREKHDTYRDNLPWLLYLCREIIAKNIAK